MDEQQPINKGGRPPFQPTEEHRKIVNMMKAGGFQNTMIAHALSIDEKTLVKYFREDLDAGGAKAHATVIGNLFRQATKDDPRSTAAAIFWAKTRLGWKDTTRFEHGGIENSPIVINTGVPRSDASN